MVDEKSDQEIRICGAPGCDNPLGHDSRRRHCSRRCSNKVNNERARQRSKEQRELNQVDKVCAIEDCNNLVLPPRRRHCSDHCAVKAQRGQVRRTSETSRKMKRALSKSKHERHLREIRTIRSMQHIPVERWAQYKFVKRGLT